MLLWGKVFTEYINVTGKIREIREPEKWIDCLQFSVDPKDGWDSLLTSLLSSSLFYNNKMSLIIISVLGWGQISVIHFTQQTGNTNLTVQRHLIHSKLNDLIMPVRYFHFSSGFLCTFIVLFNQSLIYSPYNYNLSGSSLVLCLYPYFIISTAECNVYFFF